VSRARARRELEERVATDRAANARTPTLLTLMFNPAGGAAAVSRSCALRRPTASCIAEDALGLVRRRERSVSAPCSVLCKLAF